MENYQGILMAECVMRERRERAQRAADRWYQTSQGTQEPTLRESLAGALIALALWIAPSHAALSVQHR
jgi:hypothetical protein